MSGSTVMAIAVNPAGAVTLQSAYDNATTPPQILINGTPDPMTIDASVAGVVFSVRGFTGINLINMATTGSAIVGGHSPGNILTLEGALPATADTGIVRSNSPIDIAYNTIDNTTPVESFAIRWDPIIAASTTYVGGCLTVAPVFTVTTGLFIPATFSDTSNVMIGATPAFSAFTFINELAVIRNSGNFNLPSALVMNVGLTHERNSSGTSTTPGTTGISFSPQTRSTVSGAVMTKTSQTAVRCSPTFSTVGGATVSLGTIRGLHVLNPAVALFQPASGIEVAVAIYGVDVAALPFGGNIPKVAFRSSIVAASNARFLQNLSTAASEFGSSVVHHSDNGVIQFGGVLNAADVSLFWNSAGYLETFFFSTADWLQTTSPSADRFLFDANGADHEFNFNCNRFSLGAQTGAVGNQVGVFVAPTRTVAIGGEWSDFLLTQAGSITVDAAMGLVAGWTINAPTITLGTGSVTQAGALNVGGNVNQGSVDRFGVRILSNPSGGSGVNAALWVTAGLTQLDGDLGHTGTNLGFYGTAPIAQQLAVPVTIAAVHAALVALGLIT